MQRQLAGSHAQTKPRHGAVMAYLDEQGNRATELAELSGQHKQVIGTLVDELEALGLVTREPDPADRRAKLVVPTANGLAQMKAGDEAMAGVEERLAAAIGQDDYRAFKRTLQRLAELSMPGDATSD
ncbi:MarR family winged helix-turn-helix transcriptional regulator [Catellatospora chokoriensis]|uniref:MarR family winged helix-turn-helix transcriptional regulator n=1 Tax=Catellatospora chokoriensis TaxID=310353 RepID=UPI001EF264AC|nr:MarR family winged helix-turn-helix transcriptional regulator [Catellatospora chokoriensis]